MPTYAQLNDQNIVVAISELHQSVDDPNLILLAVPDETLLGKQYVNGQWQAVASSPPDWTARIAERRFQAETAGITWNGYYVATDRDSQNKVDIEDRAIDRGLRVDGAGWKCLDLATQLIGFRPTTNVEMRAIANTVYSYVRACFKREEDLLTELRNGTFTEAMLEQGWPQ